MKARLPAAELVPERAQHPVPYEMAVVGATLGPLLACGLLHQLLPVLANTSSALILVLVIVAGAGTGYRSAGVIAAISSGVWFDFFLTAPYLTFSVASAADVETLIVLVLLGVVINEIIQLGRRSDAQLRDRDAYLQALLDISDAGGRRKDRMLDAVSNHLRTMLDLDTCTWVTVVDPAAPRLDRDGQVRNHGRRFPVETEGLPTITAVALPLRPGDSHSPGFMLTASTHISRAPLRQRRLAGALADQVSSALSRAQVI